MTGQHAPGSFLGVDRVGVCSFVAPWLANKFRRILYHIISVKLLKSDRFVTKEIEVGRVAVEKSVLTGQADEGAGEPAGVDF